MSLAGIHAYVNRALWAPGVTTVGLLVVALTLIGLVGWRSLTRSSARAICYSVMLLGTALTWWLVNAPLEGRTLWVVSTTHGFTIGDLLGVPAVLMAMRLLGGVAVRWYRGRQRTQLS